MDTRIQKSSYMCMCVYIYVVFCPLPKARWVRASILHGVPKRLAASVKSRQPASVAILAQAFFLWVLENRWHLRTGAMTADPAFPAAAAEASAFGAQPTAGSFTGLSAASLLGLMDPELQLDDLKEAGKQELDLLLGKRKRPKLTHGTFLMLTMA